MEEFQALIDILNRLLGPDGCPWDREQTLKSMRHSLIEEAHEVIDAVDAEDSEAMKEELGDLLFLSLFLCKLAKKEGHFSLQDVLKTSADKLIRRHPHIFGDNKLENSEDVLKQWNEIKRNEKKYTDKKSLLDNIPKNLPTLLRAQKIIKNATGKSFLTNKKIIPQNEEEKAGEQIWNLVEEISKKGIQAEIALRSWLVHVEKEFREREQANDSN